MINLPETESLVSACIIIVLSILFLVFGRNTREIKSCLDPETFTNLELIKKESVSHDTRKFTFALPNGPEGLLGLPVGQHITLKFTETITPPEETKNHMRSYTPITGNDTPGSVTFVIKIYKAGVHPKFPEGGKMSQYLDTLIIGDTVAMRGPKGEWMGWVDFNTYEFIFRFFTLLWCIVGALGGNMTRNISISSHDGLLRYNAYSH